MNLQLAVDNSIIIQGNIWFASLAIAAVIVLLGLLIYFLIKIMGQNETLKYEFITIIAHKFRTPLTQVRWLSESLLKDEQDSYRKESLSNIKQSNEKLIKLTNSLVEITDNDNRASASYNFEVLSLCDLVRVTTDNLKNSFHEKNIFFSVSCPPEDIKVKVDRQRIEFVLQSLLENACAYTPPGRNVEVTLERQHRKAIISVADRGIGIDPNDMPRLFTKFFRSESARRADTEGFGISLFLSKAVMRRHKGKLEVHSAGLGEGTTFKMILKVVKKWPRE